MKIEVTQEHIDKGRPANCTLCPIALAIIDKFPEGTAVEAGSRVIHIRCADGSAYRLITPGSVRAFMFDFDQGWWQSRPFEFVLGFISGQD